MTLVQNGIPTPTLTPMPSNLPAASSSTLKLVPATPSQAIECFAINSPSWRGPLSDEAYLRREHHASIQPLTANGGVTYWILIDTSASTPTILSACETYRKKAFVSRRDRPNEIEETTSHGIGSVYCRDEFRGKGYAGRMMQELAKELRGWQQEGGKEARFNVLYSDIGKVFYARRGWVPFPSSHVALPAIESDDGGSGLPETKEVRAEALEELCAVDVAQMKRSMQTFGGTDAKVKVAFVPERDLLAWQHSREEFVAGELRGKAPEVKGAIVGTEPGRRVWAIWNRVFDNDPKEAILYITRLVIEEGAEGTSHVNGEKANGTNGLNGNHENDRVDAIAACLRAAQLEAARWQLGTVKIWNPAAETLKALKKLDPEAKVVDREADSIASLMWYGSDATREQIEWVGNEKYGWC